VVKGESMRGEREGVFRFREEDDVWGREKGLELVVKSEKKSRKRVREPVIIVVKKSQIVKE
jgi:hypothetical protein